MGGGSGAPPPAAAVVSAVASSATPPPLDPAAPTTTLLVKLLDGRREKLVLNPSVHTVAHLQAFVAAMRGTTRPFLLLAGFPPKPIGTEPAATIDAAGLKGAAVTQQVAS